MPVINPTRDRRFFFLGSSIPEASKAGKGQQEPARARRLTLVRRNATEACGERWRAVEDESQDGQSGRMVRNLSEY